MTTQHTAAQHFVNVMNCDQFGHRDQSGARRKAEKLGGEEVAHMSFTFRDGSAAYLTDQAGWSVKTPAFGGAK